MQNHHDFHDRPVIQMIENLLALFSRHDQPAPSQDAELLRKRRLPDAAFGFELPDMAFPLRQAAQQFQAVGIAQFLDEIDGLRSRGVQGVPFGFVG